MTYAKKQLLADHCTPFSSITPRLLKRVVEVGCFDFTDSFRLLLAAQANLLVAMAERRRENMHNFNISDFSLVLVPDPGQLVSLFQQSYFADKIRHSGAIDRVIREEIDRLSSPEFHCRGIQAGLLRVKNFPTGGYGQQYAQARRIHPEALPLSLLYTVFFARLALELPELAPLLERAHRTNMKARPGVHVTVEFIKGMVNVARSYDTTIAIDHVLPFLIYRV